MDEFKLCDVLVVSHLANSSQIHLRFLLSLQEIVVFYIIPHAKYCARRCSQEALQPQQQLQL